MTRGLNKLSARRVETLREAGRHSDGGGLYLSITAAPGEQKGSGRRRWVFMYTYGGKRVELGLGSGRDMSLAVARTEAEKFRGALAEGVDPRVLRAEREPVRKTFGECADTYIAAKSPEWRNDKHVAQWKMTLQEYAAPIRDKDVAAITTSDILAVLRPHWTRAPETAKRLQGRIENVMDAAKANGLRAGDNPARWRGHLDQLLSKRKKLVRGHHAALAYDTLPAFMTALRGREAMAASALQFTILTAARTGEALGAKWSEIDLDKAMWIVPKERMKMGAEHRVPLSSAAVAILQAIGPKTDGFVFSGAKEGKSLSGMAMLMLLRRMDSGKLTAHGFRSTFRDWGAEQTIFPSEVLEMALAHAVGNKVEAAYRRGDLFAKRRALMDAWASYCSNRPANVTDLAAERETRLVEVA